MSDAKTSLITMGDSGWAEFASASPESGPMSSADEDENGGDVELAFVPPKTIAHEISHWTSACAHTFDLGLHRPKCCDQHLSTAETACLLGDAVVECLVRHYRHKFPATSPVADDRCVRPAPIRDTDYAVFAMAKRAEKTVTRLAKSVASAADSGDSVHLELSNGHRTKELSLPSTDLAITFPTVATSPSPSPSSSSPSPPAPSKKKNGEKKQQRVGVRLRFQTLSDGIVHLLQSDPSCIEALTKATSCEKVTFSLLYTSRFPMSVCRTEAERASAEQAASVSPLVEAAVSKVHRHSVKVLLCATILISLVFIAILVLTRLNSSK